jgi:hypothetical protein
VIDDTEQGIAMLRRFQEALEDGWGEVTSFSFDEGLRARGRAARVPLPVVPRIICALTPESSSDKDRDSPDSREPGCLL